MAKYIVQAVIALFFSVPFIIKMQEMGFETDALRLMYRSLFYLAGAWFIGGLIYDFIASEVKRDRDE